MPILDDIKKALGRHEPRSEPFRAVPEQAAVAMILAGEEDGLRLCMIRRAEREGDPWSGHYAFPGGRAQPEDPHARAVAERETGEEVGLRLKERHLLGALSEMPIRLGGQDTGMRLSTFVYYWGHALPPFVPNHEVAGAYWVPLSHLWDAGNATHMDIDRSGSRMVYPAIQYRDYVIWGLTYRVLTLFSDVLDQPLPHLEEIPGLGR